MAVKVGDNNANVLTGTSGIDTLFGFGGNDTLKGGGGDDALIGGTGDDLMLGGTGNDIYVVDSWVTVAGARDEVVEYAGQGIDTVESYAWRYTLPDHVENLTLLGTAEWGWGNSLNNTIIGNAENNWIIGGEGADYMSGGAGHDSYSVDNYFDVIIEGADGGIDSVSSTITFGLSANLEHLFLHGTANIDGYGNSKDNDLYGNEGINYLFGNGGQDLFSGGGGADHFFGGTGDDTYYVTWAGEQIHENAGEGMDFVESGADYTLPMHVETLQLAYTSSAIYGTGNNQKNWITGNGNDNVIDGMGDDDVLDGDFGNDTLIGGGGNDTLIGGHGMDTLTGGTGADKFVRSDWATGAEQVTADYLVDFNFAEGDRIDVSGIDASDLGAGDQAFSFIGGGDFTAAGQIRHLDIGGNTFLAFNTDADADNEAVIQLNGLMTPDASWFVL